MGKVRTKKLGRGKSGAYITGTREFIKSAENLPFSAARQVLIEVDDRFQRVSPYKTGRLVNNWFASRNVPISSENKSLSGSNPRPHNLSPRGAFPVNGRGGTLHLVNNTPYSALRFEKGGKTVPPGWGRKAIQLGIRAASRKIQQRKLGK